MCACWFHGATSCLLLALRPYVVPVLSPDFGHDGRRVHVFCGHSHHVAPHVLSRFHPISWPPTPLLPDSLFSPSCRLRSTAATSPARPLRLPRPPPSSTLRPTPISPPLPRRSGSATLIRQLISSRSKIPHRAAHPPASSLAVTRVAPTRAEDQERVKLSFFDTPWVVLPPIQRVFLYELAEDDWFPLKRALADTQAHYLPQAGTLEYVAETGDAVVDCSDTGVAFVEAESGMDHRAHDASPKNPPTTVPLSRYRAAALPGAIEDSQSVNVIVRWRWRVIGSFPLSQVETRLGQELSTGATRMSLAAAFVDGEVPVIGQDVGRPQIDAGLVSADTMGRLPADAAAVAGAVVGAAAGERTTTRGRL